MSAPTITATAPAAASPTFTQQVSTWFGRIVSILSGNWRTIAGIGIAAFLTAMCFVSAVNGNLWTALTCGIGAWYLMMILREIEEMTNLKKQTLEHQSNNEHHKLILKSQVVANAEMQKKIEHLHTEIETFKNANKNYLDLNTQHQQEVEKLTGQIQTLLKQNAELEQNLKNFATENKTFAVNNGNLIAATGQVKDALNAALQGLKDAKGDTNAIARTLAAQLKNIDGFMKKQAEIQGLAAGRLDEDLTILSQQLTDLQNLHEIQAANLEGARKANEELTKTTAKLAKIEQQIKSRNKENAQIQQSITASSKKLEGISGLIEEKTKQLNEITGKLEQATASNLQSQQTLRASTKIKSTKMMNPAAITA